MEFKPAKCPSCGGELQVPPDREVIKCMYCGNDIVVKKAIAAKASAEIPSLMKLAEAAFEGQNYEEAYKYYNKVLELDPNNEEAWVGKGLTAVDEDFEESLSYFKRALEINPNSERVKEALCELGDRYYVEALRSYSLSYGTKREYGFERGKAIAECIEEASPHAQKSLALYKEALNIDPDDITVMKI